MTPLPSVEAACAMLQQEELQQEALHEVHEQLETSALLSKGVEELRCSHCGNKGHMKEKCWQLIGYPSWHPRSKKFSQRRGGKGPGAGRGQGQRFVSRGREPEPFRFSAQVQFDSVVSESRTAHSLTPQQIEQLLKLLPSTSQTPSSKASHNTYDTDEEIDYNFAGMVYSCAATKSSAWILDPDATDHMTPVSSTLINHKVQCVKQQIKLLNGTMVDVEMVGDVRLLSDFQLTDVLVVPDFHFNLISVTKLTRDNNCVALFHLEFCIIQDCATRKIKGLRK